MNVKLSNGNVAEIQIRILEYSKRKWKTDCMSYMRLWGGLHAVNEKGDEVNANRLDRWRMAEEDRRIYLLNQYKEHMQPAVDASFGKRDDHTYKTIDDFIKAVCDCKVKGGTIMDAREIIINEHIQAYDDVWEQLKSLS